MAVITKVKAGDPASKKMKHPDATIPSYVGQTITSFLVFIMAATMRADWLLLWVFHQKSQQQTEVDVNSSDIEGRSSTTSELLSQFSNDTMHHQNDLAWNDNVREFLEMRFANLTDYCIPAFLVGYFFFFTIGGYLHIAYYVLRRDKPEEWKCQPYQWLPRDLEIHEMVVGWFSLSIGSLISSALACWVMNGGWSTLYFDPAEHGYVWLVLQIPVIFIWQDYVIYWVHRVFHWPFLYKNFHKLHHTYKQPTAFSVTAIHPIEFVINQSVFISPMFLFTIHWIPFSAVMIYTYYHGIIDHSGITFKKYWWQPWQPDCIFHDNHHQYFHVNFGFNIELWDKIHGTYRQKDRIYREDIFYGHGKSLSDASNEELQKDVAERTSENPIAYQGNKLHFELSNQEIQAKKVN